MRKMIPAASKLKIRLYQLVEIKGITQKEFEILHKYLEMAEKELKEIEKNDSNKC